jgi:hypothetical protein
LFLTYHPQGLSTQFQNNTSFSTRISDTSVVFSMELPLKVEPDEQFSSSLSWQSGFPFPLKGVQIRFSPPEGFERLSEKTENETEESGKIIFDIGTLNESQGGKRELKGRLKGEVGEEKLFRADFGIFDEKLYEFIPLVTVEKVVKIKTSTLDVSMKVNGETDYIASPNENLAFIIDFVNTGEDIYRNLSLIVELESDVLDFSSLRATGGKVEGKKITFSSDNFPDLLFLGPYGQGSVGLNVKVKDYDSSFSKQNGLIKEKITFGTIEKAFQTKVSSKISFNEKIYPNLESLPDDIRGIFDFGTSSSEIVIGQENTFVIGFKIENRGNQLTGVKISGTLPAAVSFTNKSFPENAEISFDEDKRGLVLNIGNIPANFEKEYFLECKIIPATLPQKIHDEFKLSGKDSWTGKGFELTIPSQTTDSLK